jgi:hypothetical protein
VEDHFVAEKGNKHARSTVVDHCKHIFTSFNIFSIYTQHLLTVYDSFVYVKGGTENFLSRNATHSHDTRRVNDLDVPQFKLTESQKCSKIMTRNVHNALPEDIKFQRGNSLWETGSLNSFTEFLE